MLGLKLNNTKLYWHHSDTDLLYPGRGHDSRLGVNNADTCDLQGPKGAIVGKVFEYI